ncbi:MAG: chemotaxis protein MotB [Planctomycetota bacterium]
MSEPEGKPKVKIVEVPVMTKGAPSYMVSFGDMMTLILCFFILLVSMAEERDSGLVAKGVSSFVISRKSMGLPGVLDAHDKIGVYNQVRRKFNLPPEDDPERRVEHRLASHKELLKAETLKALKPRDEVRTPRIATFGPGSAALTEESRKYLDSIADSLRPRFNQVLVLEGHADEISAAFGNSPLRLAHARARIVRDYLTQQHEFAADRTEARAWVDEVSSDPASTRLVDARQVSPKR